MRRVHSVVVAFVATCVLFPASAFAFEVLSAHRAAEVWADYSLDSSYWYTSDYDSDSDSTSEAGEWNRLLEARTYAIEQAPDGVGQVEIESTIDSNGIAFSSRILGDGGVYYAEGGDPDDVVSYYYTNEYTSGGGRSELSVSFNIETRTPFSLDFSSSNQPFDRAHSGFVELVWNRPAFPGAPPQIPTTAIVLFDLNLPRSTTTIERSGILEPGTYHFRIDHPTGTGNDVGMNVLFVVPEPGTALLLLGGLAGLARRRA